ncbi:MAG: aminotransferase class I/II-fold pyridoxal phosphate-dependent enzyme [Myxococcales bacterium]
MNAEAFQRAGLLPAYVFAEMAELKARAVAAGRPVFDFSLGNPDGDPPPRVVEALRDALRPGAYRYPAANGAPELRLAMARWYRERYGVELDPESEVLPVLGSKEGIGHLLLAVLGPGDAVLAPTPSYPIHLWGGRLAGAEVVGVPIGPGQRYAENARSAAGRARGRLRGIIACFPHNPTGVTAGEGELAELLKLAEERDLFLLHDLAYADIDFGRERAPSALALPGAKARTVEYFSLSKSYDMAGFRCGFCCGNRELIAALARVKSYLDYGMFAPVQAAARVALEECAVFAAEVRERYRARGRALSAGMSAAGWPMSMPGGTMFVWARLPAAWEQRGSLAFSRALFEATGIAVSAGQGFGAGGEGFVRLALIEDEARIAEACQAAGRFLAP